MLPDMALSSAQQTTISKAERVRTSVPLLEAGRAKHLNSLDVKASGHITIYSHCRLQVIQDMRLAEFQPS